MLLDVWNVWSLYRSGSVTAVAREVESYRLYIVCLQEVKWDR